MIIAVLLVAAEGAVAQTETFEIFGTLTTPAGERPCAFRRVELESMLGASQTVLADGNGDFYFLNLKDDSYRIRVSVRGYEDAVQFEQINLYLEGSPTRSQRVSLSAIRTQLRKGVMPAVGFEISFPIGLGESVKPSLCRD